MSGVRITFGSTNFDKLVRPPDSHTARPGGELHARHSSMLTGKIHPVKSAALFDELKSVHLGGGDPAARYFTDESRREQTTEQ